VKDQSPQVPTSEAESPWQKTSYANLIRYASSGCYFARIKIVGKLIRQSLKTKVLTVAKLKLSDLEKRERGHREGRQRVMEGKAVFRDLAKEYQERLDGMPNLKPQPFGNPMPPGTVENRGSTLAEPLCDQVVEQLWASFLF